MAFYFKKNTDGHFSVNEKFVILAYRGIMSRKMISCFALMENWGVTLNLNLLKVLLAYLLVMNFAGLAVMGMDKGRAKRHAWRIPEATLFLVSFLGGSIGTWAGMYLFRHKTKHWRFLVGMPLICVFHVILAVSVFYRFFG